MYKYNSTLVEVKKRMSQRANIKLVKEKKAKLRDKLRVLRKLNIYYTLFPRYTRFQLDPWFKTKKPKDLLLGDLTITMRVFFKGKYHTYLPDLENRVSLWGNKITRSLKQLRVVTKGSYKLPTLTLLNTLPTNTLGLKKLILSKLPKMSQSVYKPSVLARNILMLNNKRTQFYLTLLSKQFWGWKTEVSLYPGILATLFGADNKHQRLIYKKKDKTILKAMTKAFHIGLLRYIRELDPMLIVVRGKPRSSEFYDHFLKLSLSMFRSNLLFIVLKPEFRHSFIKLRKYARVKRRLRKTITKRTADLHNSSIIKEAECSLITENYLSRISKFDLS